MISEDEIDQAIAVLEDPAREPLAKQLARKVAEAYVKQENQTLRWLDDCYQCCRHHAVGPANSA